MKTCAKFQPKKKTTGMWFLSISKNLNPNFGNNGVNKTLAVAEIRFEKVNECNVANNKYFSTNF